MNKDEAKGKLENLKGRAKEAAGALSGDKEYQAEGTLERATGATREKIGQAEEAVARKVDEQKRKDEEKDQEDE